MSPSRGNYRARAISPGERFFPRRQLVGLDTHRGRGGTDNVRHGLLADIEAGLFHTL
jgi:hypothetical protein